MGDISLDGRTMDWAFVGKEAGGDVEESHTEYISLFLVKAAGLDRTRNGECEETS